MRLLNSQLFSKFPILGNLVSPTLTLLIPLYIFLIFNLFCSSSLFAQSGTKARASVQEIQLAIASHSYEESPGDVTLSDLIFAFEELLLSKCVTLSDPERISLKEDSYCAELTTQLLELDPTNPVGICSREGFNSDPCLESRLAIKLGSFSVDAKSWKAFDKSKAGMLSKLELSTVIQEKANQKEVRDYAEAIKSTLMKIKNEKSQKKLSELNASLPVNAEKLVRVACRGHRVALVSLAPVTTSQATPTPAGIFDRDLPRDEEYDPDWDVEGESIPEESGPIDELLRQIPKDEPAARKQGIPMKGAKYDRFRLISNGCADAIKIAKRAAPNLSAILCAENGLISPACVSARRLEHRAAQATKKKSVNKGSGFESF